MNSRSWVESMIGSIIILNILLLVLVFLIPRAKIMVDHWGEKPEILMQTLGAMDTPNQYSQTYMVVNKIRNLTKNNSIILMSPSNWGFKPNRSVIIQRLFPRKIYFMENNAFDESLSFISDRDKDIYVVINVNWGKRLCKDYPFIPLKNLKFWICRID